MAVHRNCNAVIRVDSVKKVYETAKMDYIAVKDVSLSVLKGEFVSILGPSGSGKTTLLNLMGTLDKPTSGHILIDGTDTSAMNDDELSVLRNRKIGFIFQSYNLVPYLTVLENTTLPLMVDRRNTPQYIDRARHILSEIGMGDKLTKKPSELSGGEQQRVAIARSLVNSPSILLADEPTGNLDSKTSESVLRVMVKTAKENGVTIVMVTHNPKLALLSDRSVYMRDGEIESERKNKR